MVYYIQDQGTKETTIEELPGSGSNKIQVFLLAAGGVAERAGTCQGRAKPMENMDGSQQQAVSPVAVK